MRSHSLIDLTDRTADRIRIDCGWMREVGGPTERDTLTLHRRRVRDRKVEVVLICRITERRETDNPSELGNYRSSAFLLTYRGK